MPIESGRRPGNALRGNLIPNRAVPGHRLGAAVAARVVEVHHQRAMAKLHAPNARVLEPLTELAIKAAVLEAFIEPVHADEIIPPDGCVVAIEGRTGRREAVEERPD